jgi:hypothetical protein
MTDGKSYFRCRANPKAPLLVLDTEWERKEMKKNLEYDPVDADGLPIVVPDDEEDTASQVI